jgi:CheY-like chemotaxis protein
MPKTVLIVEDDCDSRELFRSALLDRGYDVVTAVHGAEGVHHARTMRPQLILMELHMPLLDGRQALRYLKSDLDTRPIPVWAISAFGDDPLSHPQGLDFDRTISKPVGPAEVAAEVEAFLGPS